MSTAYSSIPTGGNYDIPPSLPSGLLFKVKAIQNLSKQTIKMVPNNVRNLQNFLKKKISIVFFYCHQPQNWRE